MKSEGDADRRLTSRRSAELIGDRGGIGTLINRSVVELINKIWRRLRRREESCEEMSSSPPPPVVESRWLRGEEVNVNIMENEEEEEAVKISRSEMMASMNVDKPHTQVDYIHHLVPNLRGITGCSFYWGKMDRYEAEELLEKQQEGSFLLRDSAQEEFLFSVSFRRYGRSLHARIEEQQDTFSFDCHDPGVYSSRNIPELLQHYKDPASCMFFEPMLCHPVNRRQPFSLQTLARATICDSMQSYSDIDHLELPKSLKVFLKEYHYRHQVRVRHYDL